MTRSHEDHEGPLLKIIQPKLATKKADGYQDRNHVFPDTQDLGKLNKNQMH